MSIQFIDLKRQYSVLQKSIQERMNRVFEHGQFIMGPEIKELESQLAQFSGASHCIGVANGTDALLAALMALDVGPGDEVIVPAFTFVAPAEVAALLRAKVVFVDIDPETYLIRPDLVKRALTAKTKAVLAVSLFGQCADFDALEAICAPKGVAVIEDGAQSFGARSRGRRSCSMTSIATTSFFPAKPLGCYGDGGAVFCKDAKVAERIRQTIQHGQEKRYHYTRVGFNGRLDTLQAAILLAKLEAFPGEIEARHQAAQRYDELIRSQCPGVVVPKILEGQESVYAQYTIRVKNRDAVKAALEKQGIPTAVHYPESLHRQPAYADPRAECPESDRAAREVLSLPMHPYLTEQDQLAIVEKLSASL